MAKCKPLCTALLVLVLLGGSLLIISSQFTKGQTFTPVNTSISQDTTWTKTHSPYMLVSNISVNTGITLTIEPGVIVNLNDYSLQVDGTLRARGDKEQQITINGGSVTFTPSSISWSEIASKGCVVENSVLNSTFMQINGASPKINSNVIYGGINASGSPTISNNTIRALENGFLNCGIVAEENSNISIIGNTISGYKKGILSIGNSKIENNLIIDNDAGIEVGELIVQSSLFPPSAISGYNIIQNNTIINNSYGIDGLSNSSIITYNNIYNNSEANIFGNPSGDHGFANNWWGTTDPAQINQSISNNGIGNANFVPFLTESNPQAPLIQNQNPTPTPSSTPNIPATSSPPPSASSSPADSQQPTATASASPSSAQNPTPLPSPSNSEAAHTLPPTLSPSESPISTSLQFPFWTILAVVIAIVVSLGALVIALVVKRQKAKGIFKAIENS